MGFKFSSLSSAVGLDDLGSIESDALEWVYGNEDNSTVCVDAMLGIAIPDCMKNLSYDALVSDGINAIGLRTRWFIQMGECRQIIGCFEEWRVS